MEVKTIEICGKPYTMQASFGVNEVHQRTFGTPFKSDLSKIYSLSNDFGQLDTENVEQIIENSAKIDEYIELALKLAYSMCKTRNEAFMSYGDWLKELTDLYDYDVSWVKEVTELSASTFPHKTKRP